MPRRALRHFSGHGLLQVLLRGATGSAGAFAAGAVLALLAQLVLARLLDVAHYGHYVYAFTWTIIIAELARLGFQNSLVRFTAGYRTEGAAAPLRGIVRRATQIVLAASVALACVVIAVIAVLAPGLPPALVWTFVVAALTIPPVALLGVTQGVLQGYRQAARAVLPYRALLHGGILVFALLAAATVGLDSGAAAMGVTLIAAVAVLALAMVWVRGAVPADVRATPPVFHTGYWLRISLPMLLMAGMHILMKHTDTVMLGLLAGTDEAGLYFPAARMAVLASLGLMSANAIVAPMIAELHTRDDRVGLQRLLTLAALGTSAVTLAAVIVFALAGHWALGLFGEAFRAAWPALMILVAGQMVNAVCGPVGLLLTMTGHQDRAALVLGGGALLNIALNAALIPLFGLIGAAIATATATAVWNLWMLLEVRRRHGLNPTVFTHWRRALAGD